MHDAVIALVLIDLHCFDLTQSVMSAYWSHHVQYAFQPATASVSTAGGAIDDCTSRFAATDAFERSLCQHSWSELDRKAVKVSRQLLIRSALAKQMRRNVCGKLPVEVVASVIMDRHHVRD